MQKATRMHFLSVGDFDWNCLMRLSRQTWLQLACALRCGSSRTIHKETMMRTVDIVVLVKSEDLF